MATANTLAAIVAGRAAGRSAPINGIGERAGNTSLEEVVDGTADARRQFGGGRHRHSQRADRSRQPPGQQYYRMQVQPNKAIVGANAFAHEAGIHQDGMLKERTTYEIMDPTDVGWEGTRLVVGKHSGRAGFRNTLPQVGIRLDEEQFNEAYQRFLGLADRKKTVTAADLVALVRDQLEVGDDPLQLVRWNASIGSAADQPRAAWSSAAMAARFTAMARGTARSTRSLKPSTRPVAIPASSRNTTSRP